MQENIAQQIEQIMEIENLEEACYYLFNSFNKNNATPLPKQKNKKQKKPNLRQDKQKLPKVSEDYLLCDSFIFLSSQKWRLQAEANDEAERLLSSEPVPAEQVSDR